MIDITKRKDIIAYGIIGAFVLFIGLSIYNYNQSKIDAIRSQIEEEERKNELIGFISILDRESKAHKQRSFSSLEIAPVLDRVLALAEQAEISVEAFNPLSAIPQEQYIELPVQLPLSCQYHQLGKFLSLIESSREFIKVKKLKIYKPTITNPEQTKAPSIDITLCGLYLRK